MGEVNHGMPDLLKNLPLLCAVISWSVAQLLKILIAWRIERKLDWRRVFGMGGMPSSHTAFVFSLMIMVGIKEGLYSTEFAVAFALMVIVIYDAMGVRYETGKQGKVLNKIIREVLIEGQPITEDKLKELVGHSPVEVFGGVLIGMIIPLFFR
jgi:uncharacterized protein